MKNSDYCNLHVHTEFSLLDGAVKVKNLAEGAAKAGFKHLAITDHGNMDGSVRFVKACEANGVKPIFGIELYMIEDWERKADSSLKQKNLHLTAHAKNEKGFRAMMRALSYANLEGWGKVGFAGRPFLPVNYPLITDDWHGNVVILTGCSSSPFWNLKEGPELLEKYHETFGEDLYAEIMPLHDLGHQKNVNELALTASETFGLKPIATNDIHFLCEKDHEVHEVVLGIGQRGMTWNNPKRWKFDSTLNYLRDAKDMYVSLRKMGIGKEIARASILNTMEIAEKCRFKLDKMPVELPQVLADGIDEEKYIVEHCAKELNKRGFHENKYWDRLDRELKEIIKGGFVRYMLLVHDLILWCKNNGIFVGPGRGSVGGSLVAYLLHITEVDPLRFGLIFERFISEGRIDLPDIDVDFEDRKRYMVEQYLKEKYGEWHVAHVGTFGTLKGKQAIKDISRLFEVPQNEAQDMANCILVRSEADARASFSIADTVEIFEVAKRFKKKYPHVIEHAIALEGQVKTVGIHAAGFVVSKGDLREVGNCYLVNRKGKITVNWDKEDLEQMGLMKLDALGLSTLSVLAEAKELVKKNRGIEIDYNELPLDDKKTFDEVKQGHTVCAFQLGSKGLQKYCRELQVDNFKLMYDASALWRPGCLKAGITTKYQMARLGIEKPKYLNEIHKKLTEDTYGQIVYQEQIMYLLYNMAGIPWKSADQVRKVISKSEGTQKWTEYKNMYAEGCVKKGTLGRKEAEEMFDKLRFFAIYAFNMSHAVEYGLISYWTCFMKVNYPIEFFCALLNCGNVEGEDYAGEEDKIDVVLKEAKRMGITITAPDINRSGPAWSIETEEKIVGHK